MTTIDVSALDEKSVQALMEAAVRVKVRRRPISKKPIIYVYHHNKEKINNSVDHNNNDNDNGGEHKGSHDNGIDIDMDINVILHSSYDHLVSIPTLPTHVMRSNDGDQSNRGIWKLSRLTSSGGVIVDHREWPSLFWEAERDLDQWASSSHDIPSSASFKGASDQLSGNELYCIRRDNVVSWLRSSLTSLLLSTREIDEFVEFWETELTSSPFVAIRLLASSYYHQTHTKPHTSATNASHLIPNHDDTINNDHNGIQPSSFAKLVGNQLFASLPHTASAGANICYTNRVFMLHRPCYQPIDGALTSTYIPALSSSNGKRDVANRYGDANLSVIEWGGARIDSLSL
jgi:hypothetical protein